MAVTRTQPSPDQSGPHAASAASTVASATTVAAPVTLDLNDAEPLEPDICDSHCARALCVEANPRPVLPQPGSGEAFGQAALRNTVNQTAHDLYQLTGGMGTDSASGTAVLAAYEREHGRLDPMVAYFVLQTLIHGLGTQAAPQDRYNALWSLEPLLDAVARRAAESYAELPPAGLVTQQKMKVLARLLADEGITLILPPPSDATKACLTIDHSRARTQREICLRHMLTAYTDPNAGLRIELNVDADRLAAISLAFDAESVNFSSREIGDFDNLLRVMDRRLPKDSAKAEESAPPHDLGVRLGISYGGTFAEPGMSRGFGAQLGFMFPSSGRLVLGVHEILSYTNERIADKPKMRALFAGGGMNAAYEITSKPGRAGIEGSVNVGFGSTQNPDGKGRSGLALNLNVGPYLDFYWLRVTPTLGITTPLGSGPVAFVGGFDFSVIFPWEAVVRVSGRSK
jgi:hypothetical protein